MVGGLVGLGVSGEVVLHAFIFVFFITGLLTSFIPTVDNTTILFALVEQFISRLEQSAETKLGVQLVDFVSAGVRNYHRFAN